jgi:hypothetical protein
MRSETKAIAEKINDHDAMFKSQDERLAELKASGGFAKPAPKQRSSGLFAASSSGSSSASSSSPALLARSASTTSMSSLTSGDTCPPSDLDADLPDKTKGVFLFARIALRDRVMRFFTDRRQWQATQGETISHRSVREKVRAGSIEEI